MPRLQPADEKARGALALQDVGKVKQRITWPAPMEIDASARITIFIVRLI